MWCAPACSTTRRNAGQLPRHAGGDAGAGAVHGLRQSRHRGRARRRAGLLRRRAGRRLRGAGRRGALLRQAARADLRVALAKAASLRGGRRLPLERVLAIGDSVRTDLTGAAAFGLDCLFVTSGLHAEQYGLARRAGPRRPNACLPPPASRQRRSCADLCGDGYAQVGPAASVFSENTASILAFSVWALNGLTM